MAAWVVLADPVLVRIQAPQLDFCPALVYPECSAPDLGDLVGGSGGLDLGARDEPSARGQTAGAPRLMGERGGSGKSFITGLSVRRSAA
jgi:hypothetical protein